MRHQRLILIIIGLFFSAAKLAGRLEAAPPAAPPTKEGKRLPSAQDQARNRLSVQHILAGYAQGPEACAAFFSPDKIRRFFSYYTIGAQPPSAAAKKPQDMLAEYGACASLASGREEFCAGPPGAAGGRDSYVGEQCRIRQARVAFFRALFMTHSDENAACLKYLAAKPKRQGPAVEAPRQKCLAMTALLKSRDERDCGKAAQNPGRINDCRRYIRAMKTGKSSDCPAVRGRPTPECADLAGFAPAVLDRVPCRSWDCAQNLSVERCEPILADLGPRFCAALPELRQEKEGVFDDAFIRVLFGGG